MKWGYRVTWEKEAFQSSWHSSELEARTGLWALKTGLWVSRDLGDRCVPWAVPGHSAGEGYGLLALFILGVKRPQAGDV